VSHERHCTHCDQWYPVEEWDEDEHVMQTWGGQTTAILRTVECPGCRSTLDAHAPALRESSTD
jgi:uncharacterized protein YbaR (Trm112 family)